MSSFCVAFTGFFGSLCGVQKNMDKESTIEKDVVVFESDNLNLVVPEHSLAKGSVKVIPSSGISNFSEWGDVENGKAFDLIQRVIHIWESRGITDYLIYGKESENSKSKFGWEIVPYPKDGWRFWKQLRVLWNITFGGLSLQPNEKQKIVKEFKENKESFPKEQLQSIESIQKVVQQNDAFCNKQVIENQRVFEGKEVNVLYNYAPIVMGEEKLHFLIVPKEHRLGFSELTKSEYLETLKIAKKITNFYKKRGYHTAYIFDKTGIEAGQTVPHWHEHLVFTSTKSQDFFGKLKVFKNMLFGSSPLPKKELEQKVKLLKEDLRGCLESPIG